MDGLVKVLKWAQTLQNLQTFLYIGTATSCGMDARNRVIHEDESPNENANHLVRYTYTKMMGELLLRQYLDEEKVLVVRPSIITGDSRDVRPRSPIILWAIATVNQLRLIPVNSESTLDMVPVDFVAEAIIQLLRSQRHHSVYHVSSGRKGATSPLQICSFLEANFEDMPPYRFVEKLFLNQIKLWSKRALKPESELYQYQSYLGYWEEMFEDRKQLRVLLAGLEPYLDFTELGQIFDNTRLLQDTGMAQPAPAHEYLVHSIPYIKEINLLAGAVDA
jgi:nucleoside-diphosphate-sugar epimerase